MKHRLSRSFTFALCCLFACVGLARAEPEQAGAQPPRCETIAYKEVDGRRLLLDVCSPQTAPDGQPQAGLPVLVVVHGGGWGSGDRKTVIKPVLNTLTEHGYLYVSIDYRLSPQSRWPACREDVEDAVAWTKQNIGQHGGDPERIGVLGYSAGGQLAFWAAINDRAPNKLKAVVGLAPATDFLEDLGRRSGPSVALRDLMNCVDNEPLGQTLQRLYEASPINFLHDQMPPILLIHGTDDRSVPVQQSLHIQHKIEEKKWPVPCEVYRVEGAGHRQTEWDQFDPGYREKLIDWLQAHL